VSEISSMAASNNRNSLVIRDPAQSDEADWRRLWAGYCSFYEANVPEAVTAATWKRMVTPGSPLFGRIAQIKEGVAGFTISIIHEGSWTLHPNCYLEWRWTGADPGPARAGEETSLVASLLAHP